MHYLTLFSLYPVSTMPAGTGTDEISSQNPDFVVFHVLPTLAGMSCFLVMIMPLFNHRGFPF